MRQARSRHREICACEERLGIGQEPPQKESSDMTRVRTLGLCSIAMLALSAGVTASASAALPEFTGPFPTPFTSKSGITTLETVKKAVITCKADKGSGEVTGPKSGTMKITFTGCEFVTIGVVCNSTGVPPGEIVTAPLVMTLGY